MELPTGTITFLFTDIEGSTKLLSGLGKLRYGELLAQHRSLLRDAFERHDGHEVDTQGDAFFVTFRRARDAVAAAADAQRALSSQDWLEGVRVRVRMGIHTGEAELEGDHYVGISVHRTQRICAAAHGGQALLSATTADVVEDDLPDGVSLRDLGPQRLKDIARPERVFQLVIEGVASEFPPLRTPARKRRLWPVAASATVLIAGGIAAGVVLSTGGSSKAKPVPVTANSIAIIDPATNRVVADTPVGTFPGVAVGAGGVWVMNRDDGTVQRLDPKTYRVTRTVAVGQAVTGIAADRANVWASEPYTGKAVRIEPEFGRIDRIVRVSPGANAGRGAAAPGPVAVGFGSAWVGADVPLSAVLRINPERGAVVATIGPVHIGDLRPGGFDESGGLAVGDGAVWVSSTDDNAVLRIEPTHNTIGNPIPISDGPAALAVSKDAVWVAVPVDNTVWRINSATQTPVGAVTVGKYPTGVAAGEGAVWVANEFAGTVSRIDPKSNRIVKTIHVGHSPGGVAVGYGKVWVAVREP